MKHTLAVSYLLEQKDNNMVIFMLDYTNLKTAYKEIKQELEPVLDKVKQIIFVSTNESHHEKIGNFFVEKYGCFK